jgi:hypothetical protein
MRSLPALLQDVRRHFAVLVVDAEFNRLSTHASVCRERTGCGLQCDKPWLTYLTHVSTDSSTRRRWAQQQVLTLRVGMAGWLAFYLSFRAAGCHIISVAWTDSTGIHYCRSSRNSTVRCSHQPICSILSQVPHPLHTLCPYTETTTTSGCLSSHRLSAL